MEDSSIKIIKDSIMDQSCVNHIKLHLTENLCHIGCIVPTWEKATGGTITPARSLGTFQNLSYQQTSLRMMTDASCWGQVGGTTIGWSRLTRPGRQRSVLDPGGCVRARPTICQPSWTSGVSVGLQSCEQNILPKVSSTLLLNIHPRLESSSLREECQQLYVT